jgi:hypothetical protein
MGATKYARSPVSSTVHAFPSLASPSVIPLLLIVCEQSFPPIGARRWAMPRVRRKFVEGRHFCVTHCHGCLYLVRIEIIEIAIYSVHYISLVRGECGWRVDRESQCDHQSQCKALEIHSSLQMLGSICILNGKKQSSRMMAGEIGHSTQNPSTSVMAMLRQLPFLVRGVGQCTCAPTLLSDCRLRFAGANSHRSRSMVVHIGGNVPFTRSDVSVAFTRTVEGLGMIAGAV